MFKQFSGGGPPELASALEDPKKIPVSLLLPLLGTLPTLSERYNIVTYNLCTV